MEESYSIQKVEDINLHSRLVRCVKNSLGIKQEEHLSKVHKYIEITNINKMRLKAIGDLNKNFSAKEVILGIAGQHITSVLGSDLVSQKKLNLSIQMPNDKTSILDIHTDCVSADSPFQLVLWIPLTDSFDTNSMYICPIEESVNKIINIKNSITDKGIYEDPFSEINSNPIEINKDSFLLFSPLAFHGNRLNETNATRISLNIRIKNFFAPEPSDKNSDRKLGSYYEILKLSSTTKEAIRLLKNTRW